MRKFTERIIIPFLLSFALSFGVMAEEKDSKSIKPPFLAEKMDESFFADIELELQGSSPLMRRSDGAAVGCMLIFRIVKEGLVFGALSLGVQFGSTHCPIPGKDA